MKTRNMYTVHSGYFDANQMMMPLPYSSDSEIYKARQDTVENMRRLPREEYLDFEIEEFDTRPIPTANSMEVYKGLNTLNQHMQISIDDATNNHNMQQPRKSSPACSAPTTQHGSPLPSCYVPTTPDEMPSSPACFVPTFHGMPSSAYSAPTTLHRTPPPAYSMPTTPQEMRYPYSTSSFGNRNDYYCIEEPPYFSSYGENAVDRNSGSTRTTTMEQTGIHINSYGSICIPAAPLQNYDPTFEHQGEMYCPWVFFDPVNAQDMTLKSLLHSSRPLYDQQPCTSSGQPTNPQQSYRGCGSSSQNAAEYTSGCKYCGSHLFEFFRMRTLESFRNKHPKLCKKLDYLFKHLKRMCKKPRCGCSKYRLLYKHFIDLSRAAVKRPQVPRHQEIANYSSLNRKRGAPRTSGVGRFGRVVGQISHSSIIHQQEQAPKMDPPQAIKHQPKKQQKAKRTRFSEDAN